MLVRADKYALHVKNYISNKICEKLTSWAIEASNNGQFNYGSTKENNVRTKFRLSNRLKFDQIEYPEEVYAVQQFILNDFPSLRSLKKMDSWGKDGIVVSITYDQGDVFPHVDPPVFDGYDGIRFNILSSKQDVGGILNIEEKKYNPNPGDLMAYKVTKFTHFVERCYGNSPRIMFMFGWCIPKDVSHTELYESLSSGV